MVDSMISRKSGNQRGKYFKFSSGNTMIGDFKDIIKVSGVRKGLYRGFTPYYLSSLINDIHIDSRPPWPLII